MSAGRRIRALSILERRHRHEMETEARKLAALRAEIATLETRRSETLDTFNRDSHVTSLEAAPYLADYVRSVRAEVAAIDGSLQELDSRCGGMEDRVRAAFREMRTVGSVLGHAKAERLRAERAREAARLDEQALSRWRRD